MANKYLVAVSGWTRPTAGLHDARHGPGELGPGVRQLLPGPLPGALPRPAQHLPQAPLLRPAGGPAERIPVWLVAPPVVADAGHDDEAGRPVPRAAHRRRGFKGQP